MNHHLFTNDLILEVASVEMSIVMEVCCFWGFSLYSGNSLYTILFLCITSPLYSTSGNPVSHECGWCLSDANIIFQAVHLETENSLDFYTVKKKYKYSNTYVL